jgi:hypothetical protein
MGTPPLISAGLPRLPGSLGSVPARFEAARRGRPPRITGEEGEERHQFADIDEADASLTITPARGTLLAPMRAECR